VELTRIELEQATIYKQAMSLVFPVQELDSAPLFDAGWFHVRLRESARVDPRRGDILETGWPASVRDRAGPSALAGPRRSTLAM
jgi:hypothetical protein